MRRKPKASQPVLPAPEFQPPACWPQIEEASDAYVVARDERIAAGKEEDKAYKALVALLEFHDVKFPTGATAIEYGHTRLERPLEFKIKVTRLGSGIGEEDGPTSDPNQEAIDGTVGDFHDDDEKEDEDRPTGDLSPLATSLQDIKDRVDERLAEDGDAA